MTIGTSTALAHLRTLVEGTYAGAGARYTITANRFKPTDDRYPLDSQPEDSIHRRYELLPGPNWLDGYEDTGEANVAGTLVDSTLEAVLRVGYYFGGGDMASGGLVGCTNEMLRDAFLLRRALTYPDNYDGGNSTIVNCRMRQTAIPDLGESPNRRGIMSMSLTVEIQDDWSSE